jgi:superfamily I DNA/RNA helicase
MTPSVEQNNFFNEVLNTDENVMLVAAAGSGKSTTIILVCQMLPAGKSIKFLAFNKSIATELEERLPKTVSVKTFHSEGYTVLRRHCKCGRIDADKTAKLLSVERSEFGLYISPVKRLTSYAKNNGLDSGTDTSEFFALASHHQMDFGDADEDRVVALVKDVLSKSLDPTKVIDFDDMLWIPFVKNLPFDKNNYVFIDEAQDTNLLQRELLRRMVADKPYGRLIAVGDPHQAIYGFRGADANAMGALRDEFQMKEMPLSVSYRCSQSVVAEAQKFI